MSKEETAHPAFQWGTDAQFLKWVSEQPSVIDSTFNQYDPDRCIPCHVRRLKFGSGRGIKPPFSAVPMTHRQHMMQESSDGEMKVLRAYKGQIYTSQEARQWFEDEAADTLQKWIEHRKLKIGR